MKTENHKRIIYIFLAICFLWSTSYAEEEEKIDPSILFTYAKYSDGTKELKTKIMAKGKDGLYLVEGLEVNFYHANDTDEILLATTYTDKEGVAEMRIDKDFKLHVDTSTGMFRFIVRTPEDDIYYEAEEELEKMDLILDLDLQIIDSVKTMTVKVNAVDGNGNLVPVNEEDIFFFVPRMFTYLKIADGWVENGEASSDYPEKILGDKDGNITVIAKIEDHDTYGTVEVRKETNWATPSYAHIQEHSDRELWTPIAPLWMIITLIIMLAGVWGHYIYTIIQLVLIKKDGKNA